MNRMIGSMSGHFIVCGAGDTGMRVIEELVKTHRKFVVIETDPKVLEKLQGFKEAAVVEGRADDEDILEAAGVRRASAAAVALPNDRDNLVATLSIRNMNPQIRIVVQEIELGMASRFKRAGADAIVNPAHIGGLRLVSEMVRPSVVSFLDQMMRDPLSTYRVEEIVIHENSPWANQVLREIPLKTEYNLLVAAAKHKGAAGFTYNPDVSWYVEPGQTLIVLGEAADVKRARDVAHAVAT